MLTNITPNDKPANVIIIINPYCHQQKGWKRWLSVKEQVYQKLNLPVTEIVIEKGTNMKTMLEPLFDPLKKTCIISAGGDGSVHYLVNYLLGLENTILNKVVVGAIGLGSSNDFLKPFKEKINRIPLRINCNGKIISHDTGLVEYTNEENIPKRKYFIVNASLGVTAKANWDFNNPGAVLKFLKKTGTGAAIIYTAISNILTHRNLTCKIKFHQNESEIAMSNINVLKLPYLSGSFFYDQQILRDDGNLSLNICYDMSKVELLAVLGKLQKGKFPDTKKTKSAVVKECLISSDKPIIFECDGETAKSGSIQISVLPNVLNVLEN